MYAGLETKRENSNRNTGLVVNNFLKFFHPIGGHEGPDGE
jgi:hypothetical protein